MKTRLSFGGLGTSAGELYTNGRLEFTLAAGPLSGRTFVKYKCDKNK